MNTPLPASGRGEGGVGSSPRRGFVLIAVLLVIVLLSLAAYQYSDLMSAEMGAADRALRAAQAKAFADAGIHYAAAVLAGMNSESPTLTGSPYDNPGTFQGHVVRQGDNPRFAGRFDIVAVDYLQDSTSGSLPVRYGVTDEAGKVNVNALFQLDSSGKIAHDALLLLPNMTEDVANSILDWIDSDEEARTSGGESQYYASRTPAFRCKNGPLDSLEELLFVKGVTPSLLFGTDRNRNGRLDPGEGSGTFDPGWAPYLTVYSRERNVAADGTPRINLNGSDLNGLLTQLTPLVGNDVATFIVGYRILSQSSGGGNQPGNNQQANGTTADLNAAVQQALGGGQGARSQRSISSVFSLITATVTVPAQAQNQPAKTVASPLANDGQMRQYLPILLDKTTTQTGTELPARININTAPRAVLATLPGLQDSDVQTIIDRRPTATTYDPTDTTFQSIAWLVTEAGMQPSTVQSMERYVTAQSFIYRVQAVGYFDQGGPVARVEAVIDVYGGQPRILYYRDLTELGRGFDVPTGRTGGGGQ